MRESALNASFAKGLRRKPTDAELRLWLHFRDRRLAGFKFRRQHPIGPYIVDFVCLAERLVVEIDGGQHADQASYDEARTSYLREKGFRVVRFWNNEVLSQTADVLEVIRTALSPHPAPLPQAGEGTHE